MIKSTLVFETNKKSNKQHPINA